MDYKHQEFPAMRFGPNGERVVVNSEDETPKGFSKNRDKSGTGTQTATASPNASVSPQTAAKTTDERSRASRDVEKAKTAGFPGTGAPSAPVTAPATAPATGGEKVDLDAEGHPWSEELHTGTKAKTSAGLWRMKPGKKRPAPVKLDL